MNGLEFTMLVALVIADGLIIYNVMVIQDQISRLEQSIEKLNQKETK